MKPFLVIAPEYDGIQLAPVGWWSKAAPSDVGEAGTHAGVLARNPSMIRLGESPGVVSPAINGCVTMESGALVES